MEVTPICAIATTTARRISRTRLTPSEPSTASPQPRSIPMATAVVPSATALALSLPGWTQAVQDDHGLAVRRVNDLLCEMPADEAGHWIGRQRRR